MADCPSVERCPFFNDRMAQRPAMAAMMKSTYCKGDNAQCARWHVASRLGGAAVPADLYPNELDRARSLAA